MDMLTYSGTKTLKATPMTKAGYCAYRGWEIPGNEDPAQAGYLVEYTDGGAPNDTRHEGYISWSPADVFEGTYKPAGTWQERLVIERDELAARTEKLNTFLSSPDAEYLDGADLEALVAQHGCMTTLLSVLDIRVDDLNK